ncbi:MAG: hypothetical protein KY467_19005 [Gemmatimonadetes bacterium]|nr:hypothetical protein [Gemmatimonadota bacterium]
MNRSIPPILVCLAILAAGCEREAATGWRGSMEQLPGGAVLVRNPEQGTWRQGEEWRVTEDLRIGSVDQEGPALFGEVAAVEADPLGRVWVLDRQAKELRVFDRGGAHVRTVGREGGGPGEFKDPIGLAWAPDGNLWVADPANARFSVFDTAGRFVASHPRRVAGYSLPWRGGFGPDGRFREIAMVTLAPGDSRHAVLHFDSAMQAADTVLLPTHRGEQIELRTPTGMTAAGVPFSPGQVFALDPRGGVWLGVNDQYRLARLGPDGDTTRIVERQAAPVPVTAQERDEAIGRLKWFTDQGGRIDPGRIPGRKPAYQHVVADGDGGIWVRAPLPAGQEGAAYDVFDPEGRYLGRVRLPGGMNSFPPPVIRGGALYGVVSDSLGVAYVTRATIDR